MLQVLCSWYLRFVHYSVAFQIIGQRHNALDPIKLLMSAFACCSLFHLRPGAEKRQSRGPVNVEDLISEIELEVPVDDAADEGEEQAHAEPAPSEPRPARGLQLGPSPKPWQIKSEVIRSVLSFPCVHILHRLPRRMTSRCLIIRRRRRGRNRGHLGDTNGRYAYCEVPVVSHPIFFSTG